MHEHHLMESHPVRLAAEVVPVILPQLPHAGLKIYQRKITCGSTGGAEIQPVAISSIDQLCQGERLMHDEMCHLHTVSMVFWMRLEKVSPVRRCQADMKLFQQE